MIIDGKQIAHDILQSLTEGEHASERALLVRAIVVSPTAATRSYLKIKSRAAEDAGMRLEVITLDDTAQEQDVRSAIDAPGADAVIVQLPLPAHLDQARILERIPMEKDADVLSRAARARAALLPPVAGAVKEILERGDVLISGKAALVIGEGWLVGEPVANLLRSLGAKVRTCNEETYATPEIQRALLEADIVVSGAGKLHLITPDHIKEGVVLIDAGTSEKDAEIAGDVDPLCAEKASLFTPVPGGVGPIAVACLFKNAAALHAKKPA